jgi:hypothetical protein
MAHRGQRPLAPNITHCLHALSSRLWTVRQKGIVRIVIISNFRADLFACGTKMRYAGGLVAAAFLSSCSQPQITIEPCLLGQRLAFKVLDAPRGFWSITPQVFSIVIHEPWADPAWKAQIPRKTSGDSTEVKPATRIILYGQVPRGWETTVKPQVLKRGHKYYVQFDSDAGLGIVEMTAGAQLGLCNKAR